MLLHITIHGALNIATDSKRPISNAILGIQQKYVKDISYATAEVQGFY